MHMGDGKKVTKEHEEMAEQKDRTERDRGLVFFLWYHLVQVQYTRASSSRVLSSTA